MQTRGERQGGDGRSRERGFTLIEAVVSLGILASVLAGLAPILTMASRQVHEGRRRSMAVWLAESKLAQLRSLTWGVRFVDGVPVWQQDELTDLSVEPSRDGGGGTRASPAGVMERATAGYVDYLDRDGRWIDRGGGVASAAPVAYERRWSIVRVGTGASELLVFQVAVADVAGLRGGELSDWRIEPGVVWVSGARLRRARER